MPIHKPFAARLRTALLATTGLVVAGCNTTADPATSASTAADRPAAIASNADDRSGKGLNYQSLVRVAERAWARHDAPTALRLYATAAQQDQNNPAPLLAMGDILRSTGKPGEALIAYDQALVRDPRNLAALHGLGYTQLQLEKPYQASRHFTRALEINGNDARSLGSLAVALDKAGDHPQAQEYYRQAIKADPENLNYKSNLALSLALTGETDQGIALLKTVTDNPAATAKHRQTLALVYGLAGKSGEALKYSRMDLSDQEVRNNALYFAALNGETDENVSSLDQQIKTMKASRNEVVVAEELDRDAPRRPENPDRLVARVDSDRLGTDAAASKPAAPARSNPKSLTPPPAAPVMMAKSEPAAPTVTAKSPAVQDIAPVVITKNAAPQSSDEMVVAHAEAVKKQAESPVAVSKAEAPAEAPKATAAKNLTKTQEITPAPAREWTLETKPTPPATAKVEAVKADKTDEATVVKASFTPLANAYKPDGGKYYLQIGSYKDMPLAEKGWHIIQSQNIALLDDVEPVYHHADLGDKGGVHYRLQIGGFADRPRMMNLCATLRDRNFDCFMPAPEKAGPIKQKMPTLAPEQRMVEETPPANKEKPASEPGMIADTEESFGAF